MLTQTLFDLSFLYQVVPRSSNSNPSSNNMLLWYDANAETAFSNSQLIPTLTDQSGNSNSASIVVSSNNVRYVTNQLNGKAAFFFATGSSSGYFIIKNFGHITSSLTQSAEYVIVLRSSTDPLGNSNTLGPVMLASASNQGTPALPYLDSKMYELFGTTTSNRSAAKPTNLSSSFRIFNVVSTTSSFEMIYDGQTIYYDSSSTPNTFGLSAPYQLGRPINGGSSTWEGWICEFMVYAPALTPTQRDQTYSYLNGKYSLSAPFTSSGINPSSSFSTNLSVWLTADSLVNLTTGSTVGVWSASFGTNHFSSSGTSTAIYKGNQINGRAAVAFTTTTFLTSSARMTFAANAPFTIMAVVKASADSALTSHDGTQNFQLRVRRGESATNGLFCNAQNEITLALSHRSLGDFQTAVWKRSLSGSNSSSLQSMPLDVAAGPPATGQCLASRLGGTDAHGLPLTGSVCEFIVWNRYLEDWEVFNLWSHYIYPKYNL